MYRLLVAVTLGMLFHFSARADGPSTAPIELMKAWVPIGFDSNDRAQVLVDGVLPNTCFRVGPYTTHIDPVAQTISLRQNVDSFNGVCLQMVIPFTQTIDLGPLPAGNYALVDQVSGRRIGNLPVTQASTGNIDDFMYADVRETNIAKDPASNRTVVTCSFELADKCSRFKSAVVHYFPEAIVVQPLLERIGNRKCGKSITRTRFNVPLKPHLKGTFLLHIRSMNGQAVNRLIDIE